MHLVNLDLLMLMEMGKLMMMTVQKSVVLTPTFTYGINLNLSYKNLALNVFGNGSQGNDLYNYVRYFADFNTFQGNRSVRALRRSLATK